MPKMVRYFQSVIGRYTLSHTISPVNLYATIGSVYDPSLVNSMNTMREVSVGEQSRRTVHELGNEMSNDKLDRRAQRTREQLQQALAELMAEKHYDSITVQDIT